MPVTESSPPPLRLQPRRIGRPRALGALAALVFSSVAALGTVAVRGVYLGGQIYYRFLVWNLVLAWVPAVFAFVAYRHQARGRGAGGLFACYVLTWFFFFPNAPYIVTDFIHLQHRPPVPLWYDALVIASFAWTGLCLGYLSLYLMQEIARARFGPWRSWVFAVGMLFLGSVGIYAGRALRWNSWDVVRSPSNLVRDSLKIVEDTDMHLGVVAFVGVTFLFLLATYCATFALTHLHEEEAV